MHLENWGWNPCDSDPATNCWRAAQLFQVSVHVLKPLEEVPLEGQVKDVLACMRHSIIPLGRAHLQFGSQSDLRPPRTGLPRVAGRVNESGSIGRLGS